MNFNRYILKILLISTRVEDVFFIKKVFIRKDMKDHREAVSYLMIYENVRNIKGVYLSDDEVENNKEVRLAINEVNIEII